MGRLSGFVRTWVLARLLRRTPLGAVVLWALARLRRNRRAALGVPLSPVRAGRVVGADFFERRGLLAPDAPDPAGEIVDLDDFERPSFDPDAVAPAVRRFYERTADYRMRYRVTWSVGFRTGARLAGRLTARIRQLALPGEGCDWRPLVGRIAAVEVPNDPRDDVRGWVRTTAPAAGDGDGGGTGDGDGGGTGDGDGGRAGDAVFVALYGTHAADDERFVNIAVPLPGGNLSTVLRPRNRDRGIEWTTEGGGGAGLYLVTPAGPFRLPLDQRFRVQVADDTGAVAGEDPANARLIATHTMWLFGVRFLTVDYRLESEAVSERTAA